MAPPKYKYIYFNIRGRGEVNRLIFAQAGVKYEESRIEETDWPALKPNFPYGQLPVLEVDGKPLTQSMTIARFLARESGLAGKTSLEQGMADSVADTMTDVREKMIPIFFEKDDTQKKAKLQELLEKTVPVTFGALEDLLKSNKGGDGFFIYEAITYADLQFYSVVELFFKLGGNLTAFPKLDDLFKRVGDQPRIKAYLASRPKHK